MAAARARVRRMTQHHKKKKHLNMDQKIVDEIKRNNQTTMAKLLMDCNWSKDPTTKLQLERVPVQFCCAFWNPNLEEAFVSSMEVIIKRKSTIRITIDEQWLSEKEMATDYGWNASFGCNEEACIYTHMCAVSMIECHICMHMHLA